jgi:hypothetical protein
VLRTSAALKQTIAGGPIGFDAINSWNDAGSWLSDNLAKSMF